MSNSNEKRWSYADLGGVGGIRPPSGNSNLIILRSKVADPPPSENTPPPTPEKLNPRIAVDIKIRKYKKSNVHFFRVDQSM